MVAFEQAVALGYRYIETDVRITRDRVVVVFHDATLDRTTNGTGRVADWLWEDLQHLDAGWPHDQLSGYPYRDRGVGISRLDDVLAAFPDVYFNIDLKGANLEWPVADVIDAFDRHDSVMIGSFIGRRVHRFRRVTRGRVATSATPAEVAALWAAAMVGRTVRRAPAAYQVPVDYRGFTVDRRFVDAAHRAGAQVHCWTINTPAEMERLLDIGVDGIVTDRPDLLNQVVEARTPSP